LTPTRLLKRSAQRRSNAQRTRSSSRIHTFGRSSSSSLATRIIALGYSLNWRRRGSWGGIFRVDLNANRNSGTISLVVLGDADHASFDNITFVDDKDTILVTEDRGDMLHDQLNKLDSVWAYKLNSQHPDKNIVARFIALGLDRMATDEDNEPTGLHMSDGDSTIHGLLGTREFRTDRARLFFTEQHGENNLFEVFPRD
jgi:hypothetical protein